MATITFARLSNIETASIVTLMNDPNVRRHLPLAKGDFNAAACTQFVAAKERMWSDHGYGPWALLQDGEFIGWGGLQPEGDDADLGLVLRPSSWGAGRSLYDRFLTFAFDELQLDSVIAMLPQTRTRGGGLERLGFRPDGDVEIGGERFVRYRLGRERWTSRSTA